MFVYVCAYVVGIKAPASLCYLLMYINPTLNKDYLLTKKKRNVTTERSVNFHNQYAFTFMLISDDSD